MDEIDKKIMYLLFRDGRVSQRSLAEELDVTPPTLNYRFKKLEEDGILKGFTLFVNPSFMSRYYGFVAFINQRDFDSDWIFLKFKCVEWLNVYGVMGKSLRDLDEKIEVMSKTLGETRLKYIPEQSPEELKPLDASVLSALSKNPRASESEIAQELGIPSKTVSKRLKIMSKKGVFSVLPILDIPKSGLIMFSMFSRNLKKITGVLESCTIYRITDGRAGINVCLVENMLQTRNYVNAARLQDPDSDVMIIYEYHVNSTPLRVLDQ
ncbi:transcriptional regulator, AsnC family [Metallosphaera sedula]|uniref:Transcriptional regulator, AsnC family n=3 Tax=Metallosphaera TaxID=41980 RepID=A4YEX0_METS5|nr:MULTISPECIES: winged helix-turn-helix transcriptional regulator [Metallosphaera]ABP94972.1 transcriptional regulator, AsnC family [Metallosphaera sedula DSM 5348]AIM26958.1 transcriptional regulator, AsnC family [Metallosphaera sedula]AKV73887.1 AsnC family transcriptional regulator [Metallosphaera sedula]AKV76129.1 AsnC family transcriptional regulator [Metallosphaera sedula]AKV78380.1 AsnC family transcriptional regulator [Metallosphaera sedula]